MTINTFALIALIAIPSASMPVALPIRGRVPISSKVNKRIEERVKAQAESILAMAEAGKLELLTGRRSFLLKMAHNPAQLGKDLPSINSFTIGNKVIHHSLGNNKIPEFQFLLIAKELEKYISQERPGLFDINDKDSIGQFGIVETLYAVVQNFSRPALSLAILDPRLQGGEYATRVGSARHRATIALEPTRDAMLTVSITSRRIMENRGTPKKKPLDLITQSKVYFNFTNGDINFLISYSIDGKGSARAMGALP